MSEQIIQLSEEHHYVVEEFQVASTVEGIESVGSLTLRHVQTDDVDSYTIWTMDDELTSFYVCLPSFDDDYEEDEDPLQVFSLDDLGLGLYRFDALNDEGMIKAATGFMETNNHILEQAITLEDSYKVLQDEVMNCLYDYKGCLLSREGFTDETTN